MQNRVVFGSALLLALALLVPGPEAARAQTGKPVSAKRLELIRERMEKGQALFVAGDLAGAAKVFEAGYAEQPYAAFLFNAGVCYQKLNDLDHALEKFRAYLVADPNAPDAAKVRARIASLEAAKGLPPTPAPATTDAGADGGEDGGSDGGVEAAAPPPPVAPLVPDTADSMKSLAIIETEPAGAPIKLYARAREGAPAYKLGAANPGWQEVTATRSPANLTLEVGSYHVVVEPYLDFKACDADVEVRRAKVFHFRANLSQGEFMSFLRVSANVLGAYTFIDDDRRARPAWGTTPHGELVASGAHSLLVEAPGFEPFYKKLDLGRGEQRELEVKLVRVSYGQLRIQGNAPELKVQVDEKPVGIWRAGETPLLVRADAGKHKLTVKASGYKTLEQVVMVPNGQVLPLQADMVKTYPRGAAWTQAIIGGVFLGAGIFLGIQSNSLHDELKEDRKAGVLEEEDERITRGRIFAIGANAGFAIGGVLGAFATYNFIKDPLPESKAVLANPVEFDDPRKQRPTAWARPALRVAMPAPRARPRPSQNSFGLSPGPTGFTLGGTF
ncbi:MAG: PEGA domain-containing protein [Polyangiaceae bacterium]